MTDLADVVALMRAGDNAWRTVQARATEWRDQALVAEAFMNDVARDDGATVVAVSATPRPSVNESSLRLWTDGHRTRLERAPRDEARPELLVRTDDTWWSYRSDLGAVTNGGATNVGSGGDEIVASLRPSRYVDRFAWTVTGEDIVAGRSCVVVRAEMPPDAEYGFFAGPPFEMIAGGRSFDIAVDRERGVLLRVVKLVNDAPAERHEFVTIVFDEPLDDALFVFASPDGSKVQSFAAYQRRLGAR